MTESVEDLSARARRGELDEPGQRRLRLLLEASLEARLLHRAAYDIDAESSVLRGDEALSDRIARRVMMRVRETKVRRRRPVQWSLVAAAALVAAVATAGTIVGVQSLQNQGSPSRGSDPVHSGSTKARPAESLEIPAKKAAEIAEPTNPPLSSSQSLHVEASRDSEPSASARPALRQHPTDDASELFASAASARRRGNIAEAIALYDALQSRYPASAEAGAADIALGMLRLQRGSAAPALQHFQRYLKRAPDGELAPEALWGEAQALVSLGRVEQARRDWQRLLERYPESAYARAARSKLSSQKSPP